MPSDAGEASARRRRDFLPHTLHSCNLYIVLSLLWFLSQSVTTFSPSTSFTDRLNDSDRRRRSSQANLFPDPLSTPFMEMLFQSKPTKCFRSGPAQISTEASFHRMSLMAGVSLGPSGASCPVKASMVHGVTLFRVKSLCLTRSTILGSSLLTLESGVNRTMKMTSSPATSSPTPIYDSMLSSRRSGTFIRTCAWKIGFSLVDLFSKCGPSVNSWPITRCNGFNQQIAKPRSVLSFSQLSPTHRLSRFLSLCGQGLHGSWKSVSMFWLCFYHHRTLNMLAILSTNPKKLTTLNTSTNQSKSPQSEVASAIRGITLILRFSKLLLDLISLPNPSFSPLEHQWYNPLLLSEKAIIPSSRVERTLDTTFSLQLPGLKPCKQSILLTFVILRVKLFAPARTKVLDLESSSTSLCLMTVTNFSPPGLLVEVCSTRHVSAYSNWLVSLGLQACMDLKLNYPTYPLAALGNAPFLNVLNFEISSTLYLEPVCLDE